MPYRAHTPLELVHVDFTSMESTMELNKPPSVKNILVITDHFMHYALAVVMKDQTAKLIRQVKHFHQMLFRMIGKLASDKNAQWELHLPELLQVYTSTRSAVTGYSPHYLMFGRCSHLPVDFYFPTKGTHVHSCHSPCMLKK